jgi:GntR family transcriptional regulator
MERAFEKSELPQNDRSIPAYQHIKNTIRERIESGELRTGAKIESERQLARMFNVSLMTARHALQELEIEGAVMRQVGAGTFVAPPRIQFNKLLGFSELMSSRGLMVQSRTLSIQETVDNEEIAAKLRLPSGARLIRVERLRLGDGEPWALETVYLSHERFADIAGQGLERRSLFEILRQEYHFELAYADEEVDATPADARTAKHLRTEQGFPVLRIRQLLYASSGEPVVYDIGLYRADRHTLLIRRYR